jgi:hypothetical protein
MLKREKRLKLYSAIQIGALRNENKQAKALNKFGYMLDRRISDGRQTMVAYNPDQNKVLFLQNGTDPKSEKDIVTDVFLGAGALKETKRYREAKEAYNQAKGKYKNAQFVDIGYSLGGSLVNYVARPEDKAIIYNAGFSLNQKDRPNVESYRVVGDLLSSLAPRSTQLIEPSVPVMERANGLLKEHSVEHIKNLPVFL